MQPTTFAYLIYSPFDLYQRSQQKQSMREMICGYLAPHYTIKSLTTILMFLPIAIYITLVVSYPPFLMVPAFASEPLELRPQNLQHYEFYRLFTAPFVFRELDQLLIGCIKIWCLGSLAEKIMGWKLLIVFTGFQGLIGYSDELTLPCFLVGCIFSYFLIEIVHPEVQIMNRKITFILYIILIFIYILLFLNLPREQKLSSYIATVYGILLTYMVGFENDRPNLPTYRRVLVLASFIVFLVLTGLLILNIVLYRITII